MDFFSVIKLVADFGFQTMLTAFVFFFSYKFIDQKYFKKQEIQKNRDIHEEIDAKENQESKDRLKNLQLYLEEIKEDLFAKGIDRTSIWLNHNGMRNGKIHFIFYSLIAEITNLGLQKGIENPVGNQKLPYYVFADYEDRLKNGSFFIKDVKKELTGAAQHVAADLGTKSIYCAPIINFRDGIDGIIFFHSTFNYLDEAPNLDEVVSNIRILFIT